MPEFETYEAMRNRAMWYLGRRDYSTHDLREKLLRPRQNKPLPDPDTVDAVMERLTELGCLDDERTAQHMAEALSRKGYGLRRVAMELHRHGLNDAVELPDDDAALLADLLQKKYANRLTDEKGRRTVYQALLRRGYAHDDIRQALKNFLEEAAFYGE